MKKVLVAYSGGLDTSVIVKWVKETYNCEVVAYCADVGQEEETDGLDEKVIFGIFLCSFQTATK